MLEGTICIYIIGIVIYIKIKTILEGLEYPNKEILYDCLIWPLIFIIDFVKHIRNRKW